MRGTGSSAADRPDLVRLEAVVSGRVQGVGFRFFVLGMATRLGLTGWVANQADRRVQCVAEGWRPDLETLLAALEVGPAGAIVTHVSTAWFEPTGAFSRFEVRPDGHGGD